MEAPLTLFYTGGIRGDLALLPRLHSFIRGWRREIGGRVLLVDLGESCAPEVWPCGITEGRSTLLVLDAMGFHAANVSGVLTSESRAKLAGQVTLALVDDEHPHRENGIVFTARHGVDDAPLCVVLTPADETILTGHILTLAGVQAGQVGLAQVTDGALTRHEIHTMLPETPPDPTIAGTVDFVIAEARQYENKRG
jgi:hypothetical protein